MKNLREILEDANVYLNFWETKSDNPKAPFITLVLKDKTTGEQIKHPVWRDDQSRLYIGKPEAVESKSDQIKPATDYKTTKEVSGANTLPADFEDDIPF